MAPLQILKAKNILTQFLEAKQMNFHPLVAMEVFSFEVEVNSTGKTTKMGSWDFPDIHNHIEETILGFETISSFKWDKAHDNSKDIENLDNESQAHYLGRKPLLVAAQINSTHLQKLPSDIPISLQNIILKRGLEKEDFATDILKNSEEVMEQQKELLCLPAIPFMGYNADYMFYPTSFALGLQACHGVSKLVECLAVFWLKECAENLVKLKISLEYNDWTKPDKPSSVKYGICLLKNEKQTKEHGQIWQMIFYLIQGALKAKTDEAAVYLFIEIFEIIDKIMKIRPPSLDFIVGFDHFCQEIVIIFQGEPSSYIAQKIRIRKESKLKDKFSWWDLVPVVSSIRDIRNGIENIGQGNKITGGMNVAMGVLGLGLDVVTMTALTSIAKSLIQTGVKQGTSAITKTTVINSTKNVLKGMAQSAAIEGSNHFLRNTSQKGFCEGVQLAGAQLAKRLVTQATDNVTTTVLATAGNMAPGIAAHVTSEVAKVGGLRAVKALKTHALNFAKEAETKEAVATAKQLAEESSLQTTIASTSKKPYLIGKVRGLKTNIAKSRASDLARKTDIDDARALKRRLSTESSNKTNAASNGRKIKAVGKVAELKSLKTTKPCGTKMVKDTKNLKLIGVAGSSKIAVRKTTILNDTNRGLKNGRRVNKVIDTTSEGKCGVGIQKDSKSKDKNIERAKNPNPKDTKAEFKNLKLEVKAGVRGNNLIEKKSEVKNGGARVKTVKDAKTEVVSRVKKLKTVNRETKQEKTGTLYLFGTPIGSVNTISK